VKEERVLVIGDTEADVKYARAIGRRVKVVWARYGYGGEEVRGLDPDFIIDGLADLVGE